MIKRRTIQSDSQLFFSAPFALGLTCGIAISAVLWIFSVLPRSDVSLDIWLQTLTSIGTLIVVVVSLFISYFALSEQRLARQASTDPVVLGHIQSRQDEPMAIMLALTNVGAGAARNVQLTFDPAGIEVALSTGRVHNLIRLAEHPIRVIPQDASVQYFLGTGIQLASQPPLAPISFTVKYQDIDGTSYESDQTIDFRELGGRDASSPPLTKMSKALEKVAGEVEKIRKRSEPIMVVVTGNKEYAEMQRQEQEEYSEYLKTLKQDSDSEEDQTP